MLRKEFLKILKETQGRNVLVEMGENENAIFKLEKFVFEENEDILCLKSSVNNINVIINLNNIRQIQGNFEKIYIYLENEKKITIFII